ncbi:hypothetical protein ABG849_18110 [Phocaeicola vulgatus]
MEKMELSEALKANASVLEGLLGINDTWFRNRGHVSDLAEAKLNGSYQYANTAIGNPSTKAGRCLVFEGSQLALVWDNSAMHYRSGVGQEWKEIATK